MAKLTVEEKLKMCAGCEDDFYNGHNPMEVQRCWSLASAKKVVRYRIGIWVEPTRPNAFTKITCLDCRREKDSALYKDLPDFVSPENVLEGI